MHIHPPCPVTVPTLKEVGPTVSEKLRTQNCIQIHGPILGNNHFVLADIKCICNLCLHPHLPILHSNCAKFKRNWCNANRRSCKHKIPSDGWGASQLQITLHLQIPNIFEIPVFMHIYPSCLVTVTSLKEIRAIL